MQARVQQKNLTVSISDPCGAVIWSYRDGRCPEGQTATVYLIDGTQQRIVDALLTALAEARGQLGRAPNVLNIVPDVCATATQIDNRVPVA